MKAPPPCGRRGQSAEAAGRSKLPLRAFGKGSAGRDGARADAVAVLVEDRAVAVAAATTVGRLIGGGRAGGERATDHRADDAGNDELAETASLGGLHGDERSAGEGEGSDGSGEGLLEHGTISCLG